MARCLNIGAIEDISSENLMASAAPYYVVDAHDFFVYPKGKSVSFREFYNIPEAHPVTRDSLRYKDNPAIVLALVNLGWLEQDKKEWLKDGMT